MPGFRLPRPDGATPVKRRKWAAIGVALVMAATLLLIFNAGRFTRSIALSGDPGTATVTDCHAYTKGKYQNYECHGTFQADDGTVHNGVTFEDTYRHDGGKQFDVRYDGESKVSIEDIATSYPAPLLCAVAVLLLGLAGMFLVMAIGGRPDHVVRTYKIAGFVFLGGLALVIASLLVLMGSVFSPNI
jgi:hypothetical protein